MRSLTGPMSCSRRHRRFDLVAQPPCLCHCKIRIVGADQKISTGDRLASSHLRIAVRSSPSTGTRRSRFPHRSFERTSSENLTGGFTSSQSGRGSLARLRFSRFFSKLLEMATVDIANPPQEYPDIVGARPTNPLAANFKPFIPASVQLPELTWPHLITGTILGMVFGASSLYLVLKVGLTVSASIPVAVISITIFRIFSKFGFRDATILQNNIVQTAGSAGESIAFGLGVTMPAIMILGFDLEIARVMLVAVLGGLLGILMMIPLRRALIVREHGILKYPEGTACAEVLKAAASKESLAVADKTHTAANAEIVNEEAASGGKVIFSGFGIGFLYQAAMGAFRMWKDAPQKIFGAPFKGGSIAAEISPALLGVGYIIGPRIASIMCGGGVLSYLVLIPAIKFFGEHTTAPVAPGTR